MLLSQQSRPTNPYRIEQTAALITVHSGRREKLDCTHVACTAMTFWRVISHITQPNGPNRTVAKWCRIPKQHKQAGDSFQLKPTKRKLKNATRIFFKPSVSTHAGGFPSERWCTLPTQVQRDNETGWVFPVQEAKWKRLLSSAATSKNLGQLGHGAVTQKASGLGGTISSPLCAGVSRPGHRFKRSAAPLDGDGSTLKRPISMQHRRDVGHEQCLCSAW